MSDDLIEQAVQKVKAGDVNAFREIVDGTVVVLRAYILFLTRDAGMADDILQETYMQVFRQIDKYEPGTSLLIWAKTIARFQALAHLRQQQRKRDARNRYTDEVVALMTDTVHEDDAHESLELRLRALNQCMEKLADKTRDLVRRRYFQHASIDELAAELQLKPSTVGMTLCRAREALAECVEKSI